MGNFAQQTRLIDGHRVESTFAHIGGFVYHACSQLSSSHPPGIQSFCEASRWFQQRGMQMLGSVTPFVGSGRCLRYGISLRPRGSPMKGTWSLSTPSPPQGVDVTNFGQHLLVLCHHAVVQQPAAVPCGPRAERDAAAGGEAGICQLDLFGRCWQYLSDRILDAYHE